MNSDSALARIRAQVMWNRLIAVVEEQAQTLVRTAFSASVREAGDLSAGVFDLARTHAGAGRDRHAGARELDGGRGRSFSRALSGSADASGRSLPHQRSVARHRPPARLHAGIADLSQRPPGRVVRLHRARGGHRRTRLRTRWPASVRGRTVRADHAAGARGTAQCGSAGDRACQRARTGASRGRSVLADGVQRQRLRAAVRDAG